MSRGAGGSVRLRFGDGGAHVPGSGETGVGVSHRLRRSSMDPSPADLPAPRHRACLVRTQMGGGGPNRPMDSTAAGRARAGMKPSCGRVRNACPRARCVDRPAPTTRERLVDSSAEPAPNPDRGVPTHPPSVAAMDTSAAPLPVLTSADCKQLIPDTKPSVNVPGRRRLSWRLSPWLRGSTCYCRKPPLRPASSPVSVHGIREWRRANRPPRTRSTAAPKAG
jgi:hypothetical protein